MFLQLGFRHEARQTKTFVKDGVTTPNKAVKKLAGKQVIDV